MRSAVLLFLSGLVSISLFAQGINEGISLSELRNDRSFPTARKSIYLTDAGREGIFICDPADKNTSDDSVMTLVTAGGLRFKRVVDQGVFNVKWFGAMGNGSVDDWHAIQKAIDYILNQPSAGRTLYFPAGSYTISRPLIIARLTGNTYRQASIDLVGPASSRDLGTGSANILPAFNNTFAIGIQSGKGVSVKNLVIRGRFTFPNQLRPIQVDTLSFAQWTDGSSRENPRSPYSGIVIDPFSDSTVYPSNSDMYPGLHAWCPRGFGRGGSTAVQITGCSIINFIVGIMITPSNQQNGELVDVIDCDISFNKVGYAMGQAQSKECHVERIKCWGATHTLFDNVNFGFRHGDGAAVPLVDGVNIADAMKQLCCIYSVSFGGTFRNVYAEQLFRIGYAGGPATLSFEDCQLNFSTESPGIPYPDFFILGSGASFHNCMLRCYTGKPGMRLNLSGSSNYYEGGTTNEPPIAVNLDENFTYPSPLFKNVLMYYSGGILGNTNTNLVSTATSFPFRSSNGKESDPVYYGNSYRFHDTDYGVDLVYKLTYNDTYERIVQINGTPAIHVNKSDWTAWFLLNSPTDTFKLRPGDFVLTWRLPYQDIFMKIIAPTNPVGIIKSINGDTVRLINLAYGIQEGMQLELWADYYVNTSSPFTGDLAAGSHTLEHVQGVFPSVGGRPDLPMLPSGTYVTAVDVQAGKVSFSNSNQSNRSYKSYTFINGYPEVEMYSAFDLPTLQVYHKTLIGGATFYRYDAGEINTRGNNYFLNGNRLAGFRNNNTIFRGDTTLHKLRYSLLSSGNDSPPSQPGEGPTLANGAAGTTMKVTGDNTDMQLTITLTTAINGDITRINLGKARPKTPVAILSSGNAFTANNASRLFCSAVNSSTLSIGGNLAAAGTYVFNIHVGQ